MSQAELQVPKMRRMMSRASLAAYDSRVSRARASGYYERRLKTSCRRALALHMCGPKEAKEEKEEEQEEEGQAGDQWKKVWGGGGGLRRLKDDW